MNKSVDLKQDRDTSSLTSSIGFKFFRKKVLLGGDLYRAENEQEYYILHFA